MKRLAVFMAAVSVSLPALAAAWPEVALPPDAAVIDMGGTVVAQGMPLRMTGFTSSSQPAVVAAWFRNRMAKPLMEDKVGNKLVLGQPRGDYYVTIQLEALAQGTRGLLAVSDMKTAMLQRAATQAQQARFMERLPQGSQVINFLSSSERGTASTLLAISNRYSEDINRQRVRALMQDEGLAFEREGRPEETGGRLLPAGAMDASTMFFKGKGKDAMAVICRDREGRVIVVMNITSHMEQLK